MEVLSQAAGNPEAHFKVMTRENYLTYFVKIQGSQDQILIPSDSSALVNSQKWIGTRDQKFSVFQGLKESATSVEVNPNKMLTRRKKKGKMLYTELLKQKTVEEFEEIRIPEATQGQNNTKVYLTSYTPVPPFMLKKSWNIIHPHPKRSQYLA